MKLLKMLPLVSLCVLAWSANAQNGNGEASQVGGVVESGAAAPADTKAAPRAAPVARIKPQEILDWSGRYDASWGDGYATGMILGVVKSLEILSRNHLTPLRVCFPYGTTNGTLVAVIRDKMRYDTIPTYGGWQDNWDEEAILHVAISTLESFPCP